MQLNDYPITMSADTYTATTGKPLRDLMDTSSEAEANTILEDAHAAVYNLIYSRGGKEFKDRLIRNGSPCVKDAIRRALVCQIDYQLDAGGSFAKLDGSSLSTDGDLRLTDAAAIRRKIVAPGVPGLLSGVRPNLIEGVTAYADSVQVQGSD